MEKRRKKRRLPNRINKYMYRLTSIGFLLMLALHSNGQPIVRSEFIYDTAPFPECHAATIAETPKGLVTAFFGGTKERNPDVCIYVSRKDKGTRRWTTPVNVANGIQNEKLRY